MAASETQRHGACSNPGALVIGGDFVGLGIVNSVGGRGVPVCVIDDEFSICRFSRYVTHFVSVPGLRDEQRVIQALLNTGRRLHLEGWVLFPTREEVVVALARHRDELGSMFRVSTPGWSATQWAWDKRNTYRLARSLGIPIPRTWYPATVADLEAIDAAPPYALKPAIKEHFIYATKAKAWRADTKVELKEQFQRASKIVPCDEIMIQEIIPGDGRCQFAFCVFFKHGKVVGSMTARRRRQHPPEFGRASTYVETVDVPELESRSVRFLQHIDFSGLVEMEYKLDPRDGEYKLLDVNARVWGYHSLGRRAGVDFAWLAFCDQIGESIRPARARPGVKWIRLVTDLPTAMLEILHGRLGLREYLKSLSDVNVESVFSLRDPIPGFAELMLVPYLWLKRGY